MKLGQLCDCSHTIKLSLPATVVIVLQSLHQNHEHKTDITSIQLPEGFSPQEQGETDSR